MSNNLPRREFLKQSGLVTAGILASSAVGASGLIFDQQGYQIPVNKNIDPAWLKSLYERGIVTTYLQSKNELQYIGMPVGGICSGGVYLGGDGRLWLWDIFNKNQEGIEPKTIKWGVPGGVTKPKDVRSRDGSAYLMPAKNIRPLEQGFAVKIEYAGKTIVKRLQEGDWEEIAFEATYPMATVRYIDSKLPVTIELQAYSPFIPLDEDNSGLPATILSYNIKNTSASPVKVTILGWLENKTAIISAGEERHERTNRYMGEKGISGVCASFNTKRGVLQTKEQSEFAPNDSGDMFIGCLSDKTFTNTFLSWPFVEEAFRQNNYNDTARDIDDKLIGSVAGVYTLQPGKSTQANFVISWYFPNLNLKKRFSNLKGDGQYYTNKFASSYEVAKYIRNNFNKLSTQSKLWKQTWYDESTLPHWFLERTFLNISTLATTNAHRFTTGRFWAWEGVGACEGNCTHVWQYAQAVGRVFPLLERETREKVDLDIALLENGGISFRGELTNEPAVDGQAGTILRIYREHQMTTDNSFLQRNWTSTKRAVEYLFTLDVNNDGMEDRPIENTLDAKWDGEIAWIVGLCITAIKAGELMAIEMNDTAFAAKCRDYVEKGKKNMEEKLFNGEYFIHRPDPAKGRSRLGSYNTCHIDQVFGQSYAFQVGLGRTLDKEKTMSALRALWKYNFTMDVGSYLKEVGAGRPYALPGEGGMIMNTNPKNEAKPYGDNVTWQLGYFHECMSGFEHQVASHMMAEGMADEAMILTRAIHERYHAFKRNPFNEVECSDHYARAMSSYGTFITACGFEYHGPKGYMRFAPVWQKENFKTPFTSAKGWGTYSQQKKDSKQIHSIAVKYGSLQLRSFSLQTIHDTNINNLSVILDNQKIPATFIQNAKDVLVTFDKSILIQTNQSLSIVVG